MASQNLQPSKSSGAKKQKMLEVILSGLSVMNDRKGVSFPALKKFILEEDEASSIARWEKVRPKIKAALEQGFDENLIIRPKGSENVAGLQGRFKLNKAKYASRGKISEKQNLNTKGDTKVQKVSKHSVKAKAKEAENIEKTTTKINHRRSVSEDFGIYEEEKKLKKIKSLEAIDKVQKKKKTQKVKEKTTPKKK